MIIGLVGKHGSGKDTVYDLIQKNSKIEFENIKFAKHVKKHVCKMLECSLEELENLKRTDEKVKYGLTIRDLLEMIGDMGRSLNPYMWINRTMSEVDVSKHLCFTDVRFLNEAEEIKKMYGTLIRVTDGDLNKVSLNSEKETDLIKVDYTIVNDGTLEELENKVKELLIKIK
jgi:ABC-type dipeptide/oligopeptide/nickel transport system ATPase subunit